MTNGTVLVVDDNAENLQLLTGHLYDAGFEVQFAQSGHEALERAHANPPDVIVLDIEMPDINGFEVCRRLQEDAVTNAIPVLFVTSHTDENYLVRGFEVGGVDYITKPVRRSELVSRVRTQQELKSARDRLSTQNAYLTQLNQRKDRFFSMLAHDLRNPFTGIMALANLMKTTHEESGRSDSEMVSALWDTANHLNRLLENLLEWGRLQLYQSSSKPQHGSVAEMVEESAALFDRLAADKQIRIDRTVSADHTLFADRTMTLSILRNLISNAIKFSHAGGLIVITSADADEMIKITVQDAGVGMAPERLEKLFAEEIVLSGVGTGGEKGTGMGLSLCKLYAEQNGGTLQVESTVGKGTTVTLQLPRCEPTPGM